MGGSASPHGGQATGAQGPPPPNARRCGSSALYSRPTKGAKGSGGAPRQRPGGSKKTDLVQDTFRAFSLDLASFAVQDDWASPLRGARDQPGRGARAFAPPSSQAMGLAVFPPYSDEPRSQSGCRFCSSLSGPEPSAFQPLDHVGQSCKQRSPRYPAALGLAALFAIEPTWFWARQGTICHF